MFFYKLKFYQKTADMVDFNATDPVVILGFDQTGQVTINKVLVILYDSV